MGRKYGLVPCDIVNFAHSTLTLDKDQRARITELGFGPMLNIRSVLMREYLLAALIECYDTVEDRIIFGSGHSFSINPCDVEVIMGLEDKGTTVHLDDRIAPDQVPQHYKSIDEKSISICNLEKIMCNASPPNEDFDRSFVLFLVATVLAPVSRDCIPISYYSLVKDVSKIRDMNWNGFTLRFLKDSLATLKQGLHSDRWPAGNLALLQYTYWEKIRPRHSHFLFAMRSPPLAKYWDEELALKREVYDVTHGRASAKVVEDLRNEPTIDEQENDMSTPLSMVVGKNSEELKDITKRLTYLETHLLKNDNNLVRSLEPEFNKHEDASKSAIMAPRGDKRESGTTSAKKVSQKKRKN